LIEVASGHMMKDSQMKLTVRPLTPDLWPALEDLFGANGACNGCWCMYWRIGAGYSNRPGEKNRARAGFKVVARRTTPRPIMRHDLKAITRRQP
jgi:hypothetical protein